MAGDLVGGIEVGAMKDATREVIDDTVVVEVQTGEDVLLRLAPTVVDPVTTMLQLVRRGG